MTGKSNGRGGSSRIESQQGGSRLRKQSECEALAIKVKELEEENVKLKETVRIMEAQLAAAMEKSATG